MEAQSSDTISQNNTSVGLHKPTVRLSKQAKEYLNFLKDNNIDGHWIEAQDKLLSVLDYVNDRKNMSHWFPDADKLDKYKIRALSVKNYIRVANKANVRDYGLGSGGVDVQPRSVLISHERTIKVLREKGLVTWCKSFGRELHYFITDRGLWVLKAKEGV